MLVLKRNLIFYEYIFYFGYFTLNKKFIVASLFKITNSITLIINTLF